MSKLCRFELRTTDAAAAREFYARLLGHDRAVIWTLHEQARARGAQPHWLGHIAVDDVEGAAQAFVVRGAERLGPTRATSYGGQAAVLRDPGGALIAVATQPPDDAPGALDVVWYLLHTRDPERTPPCYRDLFGWALGERVDAGEHGIVQPFAWEPGGARVGAIVDITARPSVHPHWLFFFEVEALEPMIAMTRAAGGSSFEPLVLPDGERVCVCDDPQGAAFGLRERRPQG